MMVNKNMIKTHDKPSVLKKRSSKFASLISYFSLNKFKRLFFNEKPSFSEPIFVVKPPPLQCSNLTVKDLEYNRHSKKCNAKLYPKENDVSELKLLGNSSPSHVFDNTAERESYPSINKSPEKIQSDAELEEEIFPTSEKVRFSREHKYYTITTYEKSESDKENASLQEKLVIEEDDDNNLIRIIKNGSNMSSENVILNPPQRVSLEIEKSKETERYPARLKPKEAQPNKYIQCRKLKVNEPEEAIRVSLLPDDTTSKGVKSRVQQTKDAENQSYRNPKTCNEPPEVKINSCPNMPYPRRCYHERRMLKHDESYCELKTWNYKNMNEINGPSDSLIMPQNVTWPYNKKTIEADNMKIKLNEIKITKRDLVLSDKRLINLKIRKHKRAIRNLDKRVAAMKVAENYPFESIALHFAEQRRGVLSKLEAQNKLKLSNSSKLKTESKINCLNYIKKELKKKFYKLVMTDHYLILDIICKKDFNNVGVITDECWYELEEKNVQVGGLASPTFSSRNAVLNLPMFDVYQNFHYKSVEHIKAQETTLCTQQQNFCKVGNGCNAIYNHQLNIQAYIFLCHSNANIETSRKEKLKTVNRNLFLKFV